MHYQYYGQNIVFHYTDQGSKAIYGDPEEYEGVVYGVIKDHEPYERITKVDHVSFFTKIKENSTEHRIYQIGARYGDKEIYRIEDEIREYEKTGEIEKVVELLPQLIRLDPDNQREYIHLAESHYEVKNYEKTIEMCKEALIKNGRSSDAWNLLGLVYYNQKNYKKAIKFFEMSVNLYSRYFKGLKNLAFVYFDMKEYDYAINYCLENIKQDITEKKLYSQESIELLEKIKMELMKIIVSNPDDMDTRTILGEFYYDTSDFNKALKLFNEVLEIDSTNVDALVYKGLILVEKEEYEKAIQIYKKALEIDSEDDIVWDNLGLAYEYNGQLPKAIDAYEKAIKLAPEDLEIRQHLAMAHLSAPKKDLDVDDTGKLLNESQITFYRNQILEYFNKDFITPMILANKENEDFQRFIDIEFPRLISNLKVFYTFESIKSLILEAIENTNEKIHLILPLTHPEILSCCSECSFQKREAKFILTSYWDMEMYGNIISKMLMLENIQIRQLSAAAHSFIIVRDETEVILAPLYDNLEELVCIKSSDPEFVNFFGNLVLIHNSQSRPIQ